MVCCCDDLKRTVYFFLDGELGEDEGRAIHVHLEDCPSCKDRILIHQRLRVLIRKRLVNQKASDKLRQRIRAVFGRNTATI